MASHAAYRPWRGHVTGQVGDLKRQSHHICPRQCNPGLVFRLIELTTGFLLSCSGNVWYLSALVWWCFLEVGSSKTSSPHTFGTSSSPHRCFTGAVSHHRLMFEESEKPGYFRKGICIPNRCFPVAGRVISFTKSPRRRNSFAHLVTVFCIMP